MLKLTIKLFFVQYCQNTTDSTN